METQQTTQTLDQVPVTADSTQPVAEVQAQSDVQTPTVTPVEGTEVVAPESKPVLELTPVTGVVGALVVGLLAVLVVKLRK